jgi:diguanylate cyclase (GGDEF)-like protein
LTPLPKWLLTTGVSYLDREYRLARCGCARRFSHLFRPEHFAVILHAERIADGDVQPCLDQQVGTDLLTVLVYELTHPHQQGEDYFPRLRSLVGGPEREGERAAEVAAQQVVVRDVFGDPDRPDEFDARWLTADVVGLAQHIYGSGDFSAMPVLADALQDAGCEDAAALEHCRADTPHVRGCWVVDGVLRLRSEEVRLRRWGMTDPLTGLGGRRAFYTMLHGAVRRAVTSSLPLSVLAFDIDHMKAFSRQFLYSSGDRVVVGVSRILRDALGGDGFLARTGGDRFGAVLPSTDLAAAVEVGERLRAAVADWRFAAQDGLPPEQAVTVSIGAATLDPGERTHRWLLYEAAEDALDRAKAGGRNRVCD